MKTFLAVLIDLKNFITNSIFGDKHTDIILIDAPKKISTGLQTATPINSVKPLTQKPETLKELNLSLQGDRFLVCVIRAKVFERPVVSYDGIIAQLNYAAEVRVLGHEGRFSRVLMPENITGWIMKEDLVSNSNEIFPEFVSAHIYEAKNDETVKLRKIIADEFFAQDLFLPLQPEEMVYYLLLQKNHQIFWPSKRPRLAGSWQQILRGRLGVSISIVPKAGSVIEYWKESGEGWLGYTKAVMVDESITITGVGHFKEGQYLEETISKKDWQEWRPVWISVS